MSLKNSATWFCETWANKAGYRIKYRWVGIIRLGRRSRRASWGYHVGGYQVVKKWLGYRERGVLGRDLSAAEVNEVRDMFRRIAALLLLEPALDENYESVKQNAYAWPASA